MGIMFPSNYNFSRMQFDGWIPYIANANNFRKYVISPQMRDNVCFFDYHMSEEEEKKIKEETMENALKVACEAPINIREYICGF